jgi:hypothetical protein
MNRIGGTVVTPRIAAMCCLALSGLSGTALADYEYFPTEPPIADSGWTAPYNELLLACYQGAWTLATASRPIGEWFLIHLSINMRPLAVVVWIS